MSVVVDVPIIIKDPVITDEKGVPPTEIVRIEEDVFLDGPVGSRVAVVDFDEKTGRLKSGVPFRPPTDADDKGSYELSGSPLSRESSSVSVFGTVFKTIAMFEESDSLGRQIEWAFDAPQLLVVPRAGEWANAYYERSSHSLQFFYFTAPGGAVVHTSQSQDIVAHETAHAIVDGVAPDLYDSISPQALAIHESIADLTALLSAAGSKPLAVEVLRQTGGSLATSSAFTGLAGQFAEALHQNRDYLRELFNEKSLAPDAAPADSVDRSEPHSLSEVLSGALYKVFVKLYDSLRVEYTASAEARSSLVEPEESAYEQRKQRAAESRVRGASSAEQAGSGPVSRSALKALFVAASRLKRTIYRGLDYLPPGDVSFADFGRAMLASDEASHLDSPEQREWIRDEFVRRGMVEDAADLDVETNFSHPAVSALDLPAFVESDWIAYQFANGNRTWLGIPENENFVVKPRLDVTKLYFHRGKPQFVRECLFKVSWTAVEDNRVGRGLPGKRRITLGTTLAIDWNSSKVRALLTSRNQKPSQQKDRDDLLTALVDAEILRLGSEADGPDSKQLHGVVRGEVVQSVLKVESAARMLHIAPERRA